MFRGDNYCKVNKMKNNKAKAAAAFLTTACGLSTLSGCGTIISSGMGLSDFIYENSDKYTAGAVEISETVENIEIDWLSGSVTVTPHSSDTVSFSEESSKELKDNFQLHYWLNGTTLHIKFCRSGHWNFKDLEKELTVFVPENIKLNDLKVNTVSAEISLDNLQADSADIESTSGNIRLTDLTVTETAEINGVSADIFLDSLQSDSASIETTSGSVKLIHCKVTEKAEVSTVSGNLEAEFSEPLGEFEGDATSGTLQVITPSVDRFDAETVSGTVSLFSQSAPKELDIDTTSGDVELNLPKDSSLTLKFSTTSGNLSTDLPGIKNGESYTFGEGGGMYKIATVSGDVNINAF